MKHIIKEKGRVRVVTRNTLPDKAQQQFKQECDINNIIARYKKTGHLPASGRIGRYIDCTQIPDYQQALNTIHQANSAFMELPAKLRLRFDNDPGELLKFLENPENYQEGVDLGLLEPRQLKNDLNDKSSAAPQNPSNPPSQSPS